ncbi:MAG: toxin [Desulfuromonadales bacterium GWC2_61_20]|nr:MAG: toxin [Desulfuromonadales bacterium GWC2_61_20]HAD04087.1 toxin [Desulfuromonas sp.]
MKPINWNSAKNIRLKSERGVSFEEVLAAMAHGALLDVVAHPNAELYPNQRIFVVRIRGYAYLVPFVETDQEIFLKTIIPSRVASKKYLAEGANHES